MHNTATTNSRTGSRRTQIQQLFKKKSSMGGGAATVGQQNSKLFGGGFGGFGGKNPLSSFAGLNMPFGNGDKAARAKVATTSSNKGEARLISDGGYGTATNWGKSQTMYNVQVRWRGGFAARQS